MPRTGADRRLCVGKRLEATVFCSRLRAPSIAPNQAPTVVMSCSDTPPRYASSPQSARSPISSLTHRAAIAHLGGATAPIRHACSRASATRRWPHLRTACTKTIQELDEASVGPSTSTATRRGSISVKPPRPGVAMSRVSELSATPRGLALTEVYGEGTTRGCLGTIGALPGK